MTRKTTSQLQRRFMGKQMDGITTVNVNPAIPVRCFDWCAYYEPEGLCGYGETESDAILDLIQLAMENDNG